MPGEISYADRLYLAHGTRIIPIGSEESIGE